MENKLEDEKRNYWTLEFSVLFRNVSVEECECVIIEEGGKRKRKEKSKNGGKGNDNWEVKRRWREEIGMVLTPWGASPLSESQAGSWSRAEKGDAIT